MHVTYCSTKLANFPIISIIYLRPLLFLFILVRTYVQTIVKILKWQICLKNFKESGFFP